MRHGKLLRDYIRGKGRQMIVGKLRDAPSDPPPKDMSLREEEQIKLMSVLDRKAEDLKATAGGLAKSFQGIDDIDSNLFHRFQHISQSTDPSSNLLDDRDWIMRFAFQPEAKMRVLSGFGGCRSFCRIANPA
jgi:hypothetical protein